MPKDNESNDEQFDKRALLSVYFKQRDLLKRFGELVLNFKELDDKIRKLEDWRLELGTSIKNFLWLIGILITVANVAVELIFKFLWK